MLWHSPQIVQFYDVLDDKEMDAIVAMGRPQLKWATGKKKDFCRKTPMLDFYFSPRSRNGNSYQCRLQDFGISMAETNW